MRKWARNFVPDRFYHFRRDSVDVTAGLGFKPSDSFKHVLRGGVSQYHFRNGPTIIDESSGGLATLLGWFIFR